VPACLPACLRPLAIRIARGTHQSCTDAPDAFSAAKTCEAVALGFEALSTATAPATWGAAMDVPDIVVPPAVMAEPGARRSRKGATLEKQQTLSADVAWGVHQWGVKQSKRMVGMAAVNVGRAAPASETFFLPPGCGPRPRCASAAFCTRFRSLSRSRLPPNNQAHHLVAGVKGAVVGVVDGAH
jgi:hypothetical protein